jgi:ketosteroid isomerase-like protein
VAPQVDLVPELLSVERAFAHLSGERGAAAAFAAYMAPEAVELGSGAPKRGRDLIVTALQPKPGSTFTLNWEPEEASVAASGDLGYTWGHYTFVSTPEGKPATTEHGKYLTIWRRDGATRRWQAIVDIGSPD